VKREKGKKDKAKRETEREVGESEGTTKKGRGTRE